MKPNFDLFVYEDRLWELVDDTVHDCDLERPYSGTWPVVAWFTSTSTSADEWGRGDFEDHGVVLDHFPHDAGHDDFTEAVLMQVRNEADFLSLCQRFDYCETQPSRL